MFETRTIHVLGNGELGHAITQGLRIWGHTVIEFSRAEEVDSNIEILWLALDTPVTLNGHPSLAWLSSISEASVDQLAPHTLVIVSAQVPVGFSQALQQRRADVHVVSIPEYYRSGRVLPEFLNPSFIVIGLPDTVERSEVSSLYPDKLLERVLWMSLESAEMSKHAINSFLGLSIIFANEMAKMSQYAGATYADVERVLRSDTRIGKSAYVSAGDADGSHFLRDVRYLINSTGGASSHLLPVILERWRQHYDDDDFGSHS